VMSATLLAPLGSMTNGKTAVSLQISPDFTGSPFHPDGERVQFFSENIFHGRYKKHQMVVGGGLQETFSFDNAAPKNGQHGRSQVSYDLSTIAMKKPVEPFSLERALGASSDALAGSLANFLVIPYVEQTVPEAKVWPILPDESQEKAVIYKLGDGGNLENAGLLAMLQRKAKRIVWLVNTDTRITAEFDFCADDISIFPIHGSITNQIYDKFGYGSDDVATGLLSGNQVFPKEDLRHVACKLQTLRNKGKPTVVKHTHRVQDNSWWGIVGGWDVEVLYVYNEHCQDFIDLLPDDTKESLERGSAGDFQHFPFYKTVNQVARQLTAYTQPQVNLLAAQAEYMVRKNADLFASVLGSSTNITNSSS